MHGKNINNSFKKTFNEKKKMKFEVVMCEIAGVNVCVCSPNQPRNGIVDRLHVS